MADLSRMKELESTTNVWHEFLEQKVRKEHGGLISISPPMFNDWLRNQIRLASLPPQSPPTTNRSTV